MLTDSPYSLEGAHEAKRLQEGPALLRTVILRKVIKRYCWLTSASNDIFG